MREELHVSSIIVHARPEGLGATVRQIERLRGTEIHRRISKGKLIVTLETGTTNEVLERLDAINALPGVISTVLVYHQWEPRNEAESETVHDTHAPQLLEG